MKLNLEISDTTLIILFLIGFIILFVREQNSLGESSFSGIERKFDQFAMWPNRLPETGDVE